MDPRRKERRAQVFDNLFDAVLVTDRRSLIVDLNPSAERLFGVHRDEALGRHLDSFIGPDVENGERIATNLDDREPTVRAGLKGQLDIRLTPLFDEAGEIEGALCICHHHTPPHVQSRELARLAHTDSLTGLANRALFLDRLRHALANSRRTSQPLAVLFMDLDGFKSINDRLGHVAGDRVLRAVGERLAGLLRENDTLARWGGDEFVALLTDIRSGDDAGRVADKLLETMRWPVMLNDAQCRVGLSVGIAMSPAHGRTSQELLQAADEAMYRAKAAGRQRYEFAGPPAENSASVVS